MPWFRVDDAFPDHPKVRSIPRGRARKDAKALWLDAGAWSARHLTDGQVPAAMVAELDATARDSAALVDAGLWHGCGHDCPACPATPGFVFHEWEEYQPTRAEVMAERAKKAAAGKAGGVASGRARRTKREAPASPPSNGTEAPASQTVQELPNPVPSLPDLKGGNARDPDPPPPGPDPSGPGLEPPRRCPRHTNDPDPPACGSCADARYQHQAWLAEREQRPTPTPGTPECPLHPGRPTGSHTCPDCAASAVPAPNLRHLMEA